MWKLVLAICLSLVVGDVSARQLLAPTGATGTLPAFQLIAHTATQTSSTGGTTPSAINCASAGPNALMVINIGNQLATATPTTVTDSSGNIYKDFADTTASGAQNGLYYSIVSSGVGAITSSMTSTVQFPSNTLPSWEFACFKSNAGAIFADASNSNQNSVNLPVLSTGSLQPFNNNSLVIAGMGHWGGQSTTDTFTIDSSFIKIDQQTNIPATSSTSALAYSLQTAATNVNPTWTSTTTAPERTATIAAFTTTVIPQVLHVSDSKAISSSGTSIITFTGLTPAANGNAWVGSLIVETTTDIITSIVAGSNTLTRVNPTSCHSASFFCYGFYGLGLTGNPSSITVTLSAAPAGTFHDVVLGEYSGAVAFGTSALNDTAGTNNSANITPTSTHNLVWSGMHDGSSVTFPAGFTTRINDTVDGDYSAEFQLQNAGVFGVGWTAGVASSQAVLTLVP